MHDAYRTGSMFFGKWQEQIEHHRMQVQPAMPVDVG